MGVYSELNIEQHYGDNPFGEEGSIPAVIGDDPFSAFMEGSLAEPASAQSVPEGDVSHQPQDIISPPVQSAPVRNDEAAAAESQGSDSEAAKAVADQAEEDAKRRAHEESEAKRKAEWEARQKQKKAAEKEQLDRLAAMSDDEVVAASMKRVGADTEKLTRRNMKECVAEHIQTLCLTDPSFARKAAHPRKTMIHCFQFISRKAWEYVQDELKANGIQPGPGRQGYGCDVPDDLCYQWAEDYFNNLNAKEDQEEEEKFVPKPYYGSSATKRGSRSKKSDKPASPQKDAAVKKAADKKAAQKRSENSGQISFGGFTMPEEKAG